MKRLSISAVIVSLFSALALVGCADEPDEEREPGAPAPAKIDATGLQQAPPPRVVINPSWICIASSGTCPTGKQMFYCYESGKESDGIFSCKSPTTN